MALTSIVAEGGDTLCLLSLSRPAGTVVNIIGDRFGDGELLIGAAVQGIPSNIEVDISLSSMMTLPLSTRGATIFGSSIITPSGG